MSSADVLGSSLNSVEELQINYMEIENVIRLKTTKGCRSDAF